MANATSIWLDRVTDVKRYPTLSGTFETDVVVVGGGVVGVMTAKHLLDEGFRVVLLEKNHIATGDTGATTGFLTRVPDASFATLAEKYGAEFVKKVFETTQATQRRIFDLIKTQNIDCDFRECNAYYSAYQENDATLEREWGALQKAAVQATRTAKAIEFRNEGAFNVRKFLFALLDRFDKQKFQAFEESEVIDVLVSPELVEGVVVKTENGTVRAKKIVCTTGRPIDAFSELQPLLDLKLTYVIAAQYEKSPLSNDLFWDTFDPYFYYRNVDTSTALSAGAQTVIVGGADIDTEKVGTQKPYEKLEQFLREHVPGNFTVTHQWSGSIFHTSDGLPYAFEHPQYRGKVFVGTGFGGNGMVLGMATAEGLAELVAGQVSAKTKMFGLERTGVKVGARKISSQQNIGGWTIIADVADFEKKPGIAKKVGGKTIAVFKVAGAYHAIDNVCTHAGGSLADGELEEKVVQCPLHGAKFDVTTGEVISAPAIRRVMKYPLRVTGTTIEVQIDAVESKSPPVRDLDSKRERHWKPLLFFSIGATLFWLAEFAFQYWHLIPGELKGSLVRSFALAGATFFGFALFASALFKWVPRWAQYWRYRRYLGVAGFVFIVGHVWSVFHFFFDYDVAIVYYSLNPIDNPLVFGSIAFPIFFIMAATSTDWAVQKLTPKVWKRLHRLVYIAYWASVFHFVLINPQLLQNTAGYLLLVVTGLALFGQFYWFVRTALARPKPLAIVVGLVIIALYIVTASIAYQKKVVALRPKATPVVQEEPLPVAVEKMKTFMQQFPVDPDIATTPIVADKTFTAPIARTGAFQNLNYMTSGTAALEQKDGQSFVVFQNDFDTPNGPDLVIYLTKNTAPTQRNDIRAGVQLGKLKSIKGKQVYAIPAGTDVAQYNSVSIHCRAFNVPWSYAPLQ